MTIQVALRKPVQRTESIPVHDTPSNLRQSERQNTSTDECSAGVSTVGLEAQIGSLNTQIHTLRTLIQRARGSRLVRLQGKLIALEARVSVLNIEQQKKASNLKNLRDIGFLF